MIYVNQDVKFIRQDKKITKHIEYCGKICNLTRDKIKENSDERFVKNLNMLGHGSVMEHAGIYLAVNYDKVSGYIKELKSVCKSPYTYSESSGVHKAIYTNYRVIMEKAPKLFEIIATNKELPSGITYFEPANDHDHKVFTFEITCSRAIQQQLTRSRTASFTIESMRYNKYDTKRFLMMNPTYFKSKAARVAYKVSAAISFFMYKRALKLGVAAEHARDILPLGAGSVVVMSAPLWAWKHFLYLRMDKHSQQDIREIANSVNKALDILTFTRKESE